MKKLLLILSVLAFFSCNKKDTPPSEGPVGRFEHEQLKTADPETGMIPLGGTWKAFKELEKQGKFKRNSFLPKKVYPNSWQPINDYFANLAVTKMAYDPNNTRVFYFVTGEGWRNADATRGAGVWKSEDGGKSWNQLVSTDNDTFYYCQDIKIHPQTSDVYVATFSGLMRSEDGGLSWQKVLGAGIGSSSNRCADIEITEDGGMFATFGIQTTDGIYYSDNGDEGSWVKRMNGLPKSGFDRIELATAPSDADVAYCIPNGTYSAGRKIRGIFKTANKGLSWFEVNNPGGEYDLARQQGWYNLILAVHPQNENWVIAGGLHLYQSRNGGVDWEQLSQGDRKKNKYVHVDQHEIVFADDKTVYFGNDGGIWRTDDISALKPEIYPVNTNYITTQYYSTDIHPVAGNPRIIGGTQDNGSNMAIASGLDNHDRLSGSDGSFCAINHENGDIMYTTTQYANVYRFIDGGKTGYDKITNPALNNNNTMFINPIEMDPNNPEIIYQASSVGLWRLENASTADKEEWEQACRQWGTISAIGIAKDKPNLVFIGRSNGYAVYKIDNALESNASTIPKVMQFQVSLPSGFLSNIYVNPKDANHALITLSNYGINNVWESTDMLSDNPTIHPCDGDLPDMPVHWSFIHPENDKVVYIGTELGVFYTENIDSNNTVWLPASNGLPNLRVHMLRYREADRTLVAATHGRGLYTTKLPEKGFELVWEERGPRNVGGRTRAIMPDPNDPEKKKLWAGSVSGGLWLINNIDSVDYSYIQENNLSLESLLNPIGQKGSLLKYSIPESGRTTLSIYNINGQLIETILDKDLDAGEYTLNWMPEKISRPGIYILNLQNGGEQKAIKVMISDRYK
jgi:photosystem II stability/assembly factor-like uncharacterized protein